VLPAVALAVNAIAILHFLLGAMVCSEHESVVELKSPASVPSNEVSPKVLRRWADLFTREFDRRVMQRVSYFAAVMLLIAAWIAFPEAWTAVAWSVLGLGLALAGRRSGFSESGFPELRYQANFLALVSVLRVPLINLEATGKYHGLTLRLLTS
jgi:hypothetical protein